MAKKEDRRTFIREVEFKLTTDERTERAHQFGEAHAAHRELMETNKAKKQALNLELKDSERKMLRLADAVKDGAEKRPVECYDEVVRGRYYVRVVDGPMIVVEDRPATMAEAQTEMPNARPTSAPGNNLLARASGEAPIEQHTPEPDEDGDVKPGADEAAPKPKRKRGAKAH